MKNKTKLKAEAANNDKANVSGSLPAYEQSEWMAFDAGFNAARNFYNKELAGKKKWILLADKWIANAFWKYKRQ
jgi:hypothetical protein